MAIYIPIRKVEETSSGVNYSFGDGLGAEGLLRLDKASGEIELLRALPGSRSDEYFARASFKLRKHWAKGEVPDVTSWSA